MNNELITFDNIDTNLIQENNLSEIISSQVDIVKKLDKKVTEAMNKASGAKNSAKMAHEKSTGWFKNTGAIESLQSAIRDIGEATEANAESQKIMYDYMQKIAQITKNLITIGCSSIAMNRATVRELELKLTGASKEKLSELAKKELFKVITQLKQQEDIMSKQEHLTTEVYKQSKKLQNVEIILTEKDNLDSHQSEQIHGLTDLVEQHQRHFKTKDEIDQEQDKRLKEIDSFFSIVNQKIQEIILKNSEELNRSNEKWSAEISNLHKIISKAENQIAFVKETFDLQSKDIASISLELKNNQQNLTQIAKQLKDYRNIFILLTSISVVSMTAYIAFYLIH